MGRDQGAKWAAAAMDEFGKGSLDAQQAAGPGHGGRWKTCYPKLLLVFKALIEWASQWIKPLVLSIKEHMTIMPLDYDVTPSTSSHEGQSPTSSDFLDAINPSRSNVHPLEDPQEQETQELGFTVPSAELGYEGGRVEALYPRHQEEFRVRFIPFV
ncbi:hypothetical protein BCV69DRAFT_315300 [Microstroma glucosiphilum]|uniref:Uncharacterized protein n=1 Tax=Pseudomicrostroma glucosiphilum TaxID=1684307 RepID=A0A316TY12_9BASI|nr:hypothetical protein BCV69DRAFT_315300 [Pseudomicrostroma glucosiphilum]PWN17698.1 hypothetical protein BCV69DRAFT_315300 [Pseudomicrostroma glucosiphilum]